MSLRGKYILITGGAKRIGKSLALTVAQRGANVIIHYNRSSLDVIEVQRKIERIGREAHLIQSDFSHPDQVLRLIEQASSFGKLFALVNNASIFEPLNLTNTTLESWQRHFMVNLTAPFLLSQQFARILEPNREGRIVNILDWRALRPGKDHLPYTISKSALAALTKSLALELAPRITVNGLALGAILPPSDQVDSSNEIIARVPAQRWGNLKEVGDALLFLLDGPSYITGEIIHIDGGRHLT